jgi:hypothetical protein
MADDDDEGGGSTFLKNHMTEAQPSREAGALGTRASGAKGSDQYYSSKYGKDIDMTAGPPGDMDPSDTLRVNRRAKGDKVAGSRRGTRDKSVNYD